MSKLDLQESVDGRDFCGELVYVPLKGGKICFPSQ